MTSLLSPKHIRLLFFFSLGNIFCLIKINNFSSSEIVAEVTDRQDSNQKLLMEIAGNLLAGCLAGGITSDISPTIDEPGYILRG